MNQLVIKFKLLLILLSLSTPLFAQKYFMVIGKTDGFDYYMDIIGIYDSLPLPEFIKKDTSAVKNIFPHYNILILRIKDAIIHYNILTKKKDTLFYVFHDTEVLETVWSKNNDKVVFVIFNPELKYGYTTPYRFIVLTLRNGTVIKKEKFNINDFMYEPLDLYDSLFFFKDEKTLVYFNESNRYVYLKLFPISGYEPIKKDFDYYVSLKKGYIYKCKYYYRNLYQYNQYFILGRYFFKQGKIIDLKTMDSITWQVPQIRDKELQYLVNYDVSPDKTKIAVFMISKNTPKNDKGGYFLIFSIPSLKLLKKIYVEDISIRAACGYYVDFRFETNDEICYETYDRRKDEFVMKCINVF